MSEQEDAEQLGQSWLFAIYSGLLVMTLVICFLQLTTVQALRAIGMLVLSGAGLTFMMLARGIAGKTSKTWQLVIGLLVAAVAGRARLRDPRRLRRRALPHRPVRGHDHRGLRRRRQHAWSSS